MTQPKKRRAKLVEVRDALEHIAERPALAEMFEVVHALLQHDEFDAEYELGVASNEARSLGGTAAVRRFAREARIAPARALVAARIVRAFPRERADEIRARKTVFGFRLGVDFFEQLSRVKDVAEREALVERIFDEVLSVDELRDEVDDVVAAIWCRTASLTQRLARALQWPQAIARRMPRLIELARQPGEAGAEARRVLERARADATALLEAGERLLAEAAKRGSN